MCPELGMQLAFKQYVIPMACLVSFLPSGPERHGVQENKICLRTDFLFQLPLATDGVERRSMDVKTVSFGPKGHSFHFHYYKPFQQYG